MNRPAWSELIREPPSEPYLGMAAFRFIDEPIFFGRASEAEKLRSAVLMFRGVLFYGDSGAGKSSLLHARFIPQIMRDGFLPNRIRLQPRPEAEMVVERMSLKNVGEEPFVPSPLVSEHGVEPRVVVSLQEFERRVRVAAKKAIKSPENPDPGPKPLLIFDQFEEFVTLFEMVPEATRGNTRTIQASILGLLVRLLEDRDLAVKLVFSFREDYLAKIEKLLLAKPDLVEQRVRLVPPQLPDLVDPTVNRENGPADALRLIIRGPIELCDADGSPVFEQRFDTTLCEQLEAALRKRNKTGFLNLTEIQIVCRDLWQAENPRELFDMLGVEGILDKVSSNALSDLTPQERDVAIALLSHLVTEGKTRNIVLQEELLMRVEKETGCPRPTVETVLKKLVEEAGLVRLELRHDIPFYEIVSEFLVPWILRLKEERRIERELAAAAKLRQEELERQQEENAKAQRLRERKLRRRILVGAIVVIVLVVGGVVVGARRLARQREKLALERQIEHMRQNSLIDASFGHLGAANRKFLPDLAALIVIDAIAAYRRNEQFVPLSAARALALVDYFHKGRIEDPKLVPIQEVYSQIPCVESADGQTQLVIRAPDTVELRSRDRPVSPISTGGKPITEIGIDAKAEHFGISVEDRGVITRTVQNPEEADSKTGVSLAEALKIPGSAKAEGSIRTAPPGGKGWKAGYDDSINDQLVSAVIAVTSKYPAEERSLLQVPENTFTDKVNDAYAALESGNKAEAIRLLQGAFQEIKIPLAEAKLKAVLAGNMFARATRRPRPDPETQKNYLRVAAELDPERETEIELFRRSELEQSQGPSSENARRQAKVKEWMDKGNQFARDSKIPEAINAYKMAIGFDSTLQGRVDPEIEWTKFAPGILPDARQIMDEGYSFAAKGDIKSAIASFKEANRLDPRQTSWLNPEIEAQKHARLQDGAPKPPPPSSATGPVVPSAPAAEPPFTAPPAAPATPAPVSSPSAPHNQ